MLKNRLDRTITFVLGIIRKANQSSVGKQPGIMFMCKFRLPIFDSL